MKGINSSHVVWIPLKTTSYAELYIVNRQKLLNGVRVQGIKNAMTLMWHDCFTDIDAHIEHTIQPSMVQIMAFEFPNNLYLAIITSFIIERSLHIQKKMLMHVSSIKLDLRPV